MEKYYEKILREICYIIRIRSKYYNEICKESKTLENIQSRIIYDELQKMIEYTFQNAREEENPWKKQS